MQTSDHFQTHNLHICIHRTLAVAIPLMICNDRVRCLYRLLHGFHCGSWMCFFALAPFPSVSSLPSVATAQGYGAVLKERRALFDLDFHSGAGGVGNVEECQGHLNRVLLILRNVKESDLCSKQSRRCGKGPGDVSKAHFYTEFQRFPFFKLKGTCGYPNISHEWNK